MKNNFISSLSNVQLNIVKIYDWVRMTIIYELVIIIVMIKFDVINKTNPVTTIIERIIDLNPDSKISKENGS
jgi:hypothetical protein